MALGIKDRLRLLIAFGAGSAVMTDDIGTEREEELFYCLMHDERLSEDYYVSRLRVIEDNYLNYILGKCESGGIHIVTPECDDYPEDLRHIADPPQLLFVLGDIGAVNRMSTVAMVGKREADGYSEAVAGRFAGDLVRFGEVNIISGFARGIDRASHFGAMDAGGSTTAVLGCGILYDYPYHSEGIKRRIAEKGAVVSEYLPTKAPDRDSFKVRNRLISGMADCVLIVQAGSSSGALNTASHAAEQGREVFVIPPADIFAERYAGQMKLLDEGASLAITPRIILEFLNDLYGTQEILGAFL